MNIENIEKAKQSIDFALSCDISGGVRIALKEALAALDEPEKFEVKFSEGHIYSIGDTGPKGGIIFYDRGTPHPKKGWRYLEAMDNDFPKLCTWEDAMRLSEVYSLPSCKDFRRMVESGVIKLVEDSWYWTMEESDINREYAIIAWGKKDVPCPTSSNKKTKLHRVRAVRKF